MVIQIGWKASNIFRPNYAPSMISIRFYAIVLGFWPKSTLRFVHIQIRNFSTGLFKKRKRNGDNQCVFYSKQRLTKGPNNWSLSEVVHAIVLLSHFHSLSSFVFSCGLTQELDPMSSQKYNKVIQKDSGNSSPPGRWGFAFRSNSNASILGEFIDSFSFTISFSHNFPPNLDEFKWIDDK